MKLWKYQVLGLVADLNKKTENPFWFVCTQKFTLHD